MTRSRLLVIFAVLALVVAACGDDDGNRAAGGSSTTTRAGKARTTTTGGSGATSSSAPRSEGNDLGPSGGESPPPPGGGGPGTTAGSGPGTTVPPGGTTVPGAPPTTVAQRPDPRGPTGSFATALLGSDTGRRLVVEILTGVPGAPRQSTLDHVVSTLASVSGKSVVVGGPHPAPAGDGTWTDNEIRAAADAAGHAAQGGGQVVIRLLFLRGSYAREKNVLGVAVRGDVAAVFPDDVERSATLVTTEAQIERAVTTHEVGHLLGLVDLALDRGRDDPDHPGHSRNRASVMYWAVESSLVAQVLEGGPPDDFDGDDRADLAELRRRGS